jgi:hypothetical protein
MPGRCLRVWVVGTEQILVQRVAVFFLVVLAATVSANCLVVAFAVAVVLVVVTIVVPMAILIVASMPATVSVVVFTGGRADESDTGCRTATYSQ